MRARGINYQQILLGAALVAALLWNLAHAAELRNVQLGSGPTGTRAELTLDQQADYRLITLSNPHRLVVDLPGSRLAAKTTLPAAAGVVRAVRSGQPEPGTARIVFDLHAPVVALKPRLESGPGGTRLVIEWPGDGQADPIARIAAASLPVSSPDAATTAATQAAPPATTTPATTSAAPAAGAGAPATQTPEQVAAASAAATARLVAELRGHASTSVAAGAAAPASNPASPPQPQSTHDPSLQRAVPTLSAPPAPAVAAQATEPPPAPAVRGRAVEAGSRPLVIAIDAGHGGQDPGAIGPSGKREKDITLAIARELARQVNATPGLRAHLVRDKDMFIPLDHRARIARQARADMFISIHADAAENRNAKGSSVYVLSLRGASSQRARWLADKENAADLIGGVRAPASGGDMLTNVLLDLTQSGHMKASEDAGNHILAGLKRIGNNHKPHIERANFAVLRTSDMPAMLVETAFLSNPDEERRLIDPQFQGTVARAILDGVHTYFSSQPPPGTLYAARAAASRVATLGGSP